MLSIFSCQSLVTRLCSDLVKHWNSYLANIRHVAVDKLAYYVITMCPLKIKWFTFLRFLHHWNTYINTHQIILYFKKQYQSIKSILHPVYGKYLNFILNIRWIVHFRRHEINTSNILHTLQKTSLDYRTCGLRSTLQCR